MAQWEAVMHTMTNIPAHGQSRHKVRPVIDGMTLELRVFDEDRETGDRMRHDKPDRGIGTQASLYLGAFIGSMAPEKQHNLMRAIGDALCFVLRKGQESGYEQAKAELREWIGP